MARQKSFKNLKLQDKYLVYFSQSGYRPAPSRSKYVVMTNGINYVFLGSSGAVRVNSRNAVAGSSSFTDQFRGVMENWALNKGYVK